MLNPIPNLTRSLNGYTLRAFRRDFLAGLNVMALAFPLSMAFAIASGVSPEAGIHTSVIGGALIALFGGSKVQVGGPTGAFVVITGGILARHGFQGMVLCTMMAGGMLCLMGAAKLGTIIRYIPYPVTRAFTMGIAVLILASQLQPFFGLPVAMPLDFPGKVPVFLANAHAIHLPTTLLGLASVAVMAFWPAKLSGHLPAALAGLVLMTVAAGLLGLPETMDVATVGTAFGGFSGAPPTLTLPSSVGLRPGELLQPAFTIALLVAMQALLSASVSDGMIDHRHDSNRELIGQGIANLIAPLFGCIPVTGAVARTVLNARVGGRTPVAALAHCILLALVVILASPVVAYIPLATLSAVLVVSSFRMVSWNQLTRIRRWPRSDALVFLATFSLTVLANLTLAVEVGVVLAALLMVKRVSETSRITLDDESNESEASQDSPLGPCVPPGVLVFRIFGAFMFGVADKLDDELKRSSVEPDVLILRLGKVLAIDATGLQALEDLHDKLKANGKHLLLSGPHTQPLLAMQKSGFLDRLGMDNACPDIAAALARARLLLELPPDGPPV